MPIDLVASRLLSSVSLLGFTSCTKAFLDPIHTSKKNPQEQAPKLSKNWMKLYGLKDLVFGAGMIGFFTAHLHPLETKILLQIGVLADGAELFYLYYWRGVISRRVMILWSTKALHSCMSGIVWSGLLTLTCCLFKKKDFQPKVCFLLDNITLAPFCVACLVYSLVRNAIDGFINGDKKGEMK